MLLKLKQNQIDKLTNEAYQQKPIEACALLFGVILKNLFLVKKIVLAPNILNSKVEFKIDPLLIITETDKADKQGLELIGFFHSHPARAYPSTKDLEYMKPFENAVWLIFSLTEDKFGGFIFWNKKLEELQLIIEPEN